MLSKVSSVAGLPAQGFVHARYVGDWAAVSQTSSCHHGVSMLTGMDVRKELGGARLIAWLPPWGGGAAGDLGGTKVLARQSSGGEVAKAGGPAAGS